LFVIDRIKSGELSLKVLTKDELRRLCKECGLNELKTDIVIYLVIDELRNVDIYKMLGYSKRRYYEIKHEIKSLEIFKEI